MVTHPVLYLLPLEGSAAGFSSCCIPIGKWKHRGNTECCCSGNAAPNPDLDRSECSSMYVCSGPAAWPSAYAECRAVFTPSLYKTASKPCFTYLCKIYWLFMGWIIHVPYICINSCQLPECSQQKAVVLWEGLAGELPWMQNLSKKSSREFAFLARSYPGFPGSTRRKWVTDGQITFASYLRMGVLAGGCCTTGHWVSVLPCGSWGVKGFLGPGIIGVWDMPGRWCWEPGQQHLVLGCQ